MRKIRFFITGLIAFLATSVQGQDVVINPWTATLGAHAVGHGAMNPFSSTGNFFKMDNWSIMPPLSSASVSYSFTNYLAVDLSASVGEISNSRWAVDKSFFLKGGPGVIFSPVGLFAEDFWLQPYIGVSANYHYSDYEGKTFIAVPESRGVGKHHFLLAGELGTKIWFTDNFGLSGGVSYNYVPTVKLAGNVGSENKQAVRIGDFVQANVGLSFRFGGSVPVIEEVEDLEPVVVPEVVVPDPIVVEKEVIKEVPVEVIRIVNANFENILFNFNKSTINPKSMWIIKDAAKKINEQLPDSKFSVEGHTDSTGTPVVNQRVSEARAESVRKALIAEGVNASNLESVGRGEDKPKATNATAEGRAKNRRVELVIKN